MGTVHVTGKAQRGFLKDLMSQFADVQDVVSAGFATEDLYRTISRQFEEYFLTPIMQAWQTNIAPFEKLEFNLPGSYYQRSTGAGMRRKMETFMQSLSPYLFQAFEGARGRDIQARDIYARLYGMAGGLATAPTLAPKREASWEERMGSLMQGIGNLASITVQKGF